MWVHSHIGVKSYEMNVYAPPHMFKCVWGVVESHKQACSYLVNLDRQRGVILIIRAMGENATSGNLSFLELRILLPKLNKQNAKKNVVWVLA